MLGHPSSRATVSARHSTTSSSPTSQVRASTPRRMGRSTPASSSSPPLRYSGSPVSCSGPSRDACPLERLEQRIGKPLRKLVERHPARSARMPPHVADRQRPDRRAALPSRRSRMDAALHDAETARMRQQMSNSAPGPIPADAAQTAQQAARPSRPISGLWAPAWKPIAMSSARAPPAARRRRAADRPGARRTRRGKHTEARDAQPFRARVASRRYGLSTELHAGPAPASSSTRPR